MVFGLPEIPLLLKGTNNTLLLVTTTYLNFFFFKLIDHFLVHESI